MTFLSVKNLSKSFGLKVLFEDLTFGLAKGDKTALVAPNGTGKSTLLNVLAGNTPADSGEVTVRNGIKVDFLEQEPQLDDKLTIREFISEGNSDTVEIIMKYEAAVEAQAESFTPETQKAFEKALAAMDAANAWDYEQRMHQVLGKLNIHNLDQPISLLSGGERKRVALAFVLLDNPDLLLLDEPTNHLDVDMIEWLENYLAKSTTTLLMITHDRYFLDRVCNHIIEIDRGKLYHHNGNYGYYLEKKQERQQIEKVEVGKAGQLLKKELDWMRRSPKARTTKSKSRIAAFYETEEKANQKMDDSTITLEVSMQRMGSKILELHNLSKRFGETVILNDFSYSFKRGERIGIIGRNGVGKSTFLNVLTQEIEPDNGWIDTGSTIVYGHYTQKGIIVDENKRAIDVLKEVAEVITLADGKTISASQFLEHFMFSPEMQYTLVHKLSGGERRRLGLMMVLLKNPNFLILDEPTNDLDLITLQRLEEFLLGFGGCLLIVSHDRFFMDKLVQHYFVFEGNGKIRDFHGTYLEYREEQKNQEVASKQNVSPKQKTVAEPTSKIEQKTGLSYKEQKELRKLEQQIEALENEKSEIEQSLASGTLDESEIVRLSKSFAELQETLDLHSLRWLELAEKDSN